MAPTIFEDDMEACSYQNSHRILRHRSVINYGKQVSYQLKISNAKWLTDLKVKSLQSSMTKGHAEMNH